MKLLRGWCYASSGVGWGGVGVGWDGDDNVPCTCTHGRCYANIMFLALARMVRATQHHVSCTCTHGWCYATSCFLHLHTWSVLRNIMGWGGVGVGWGGVGMITFLALAHMVGATQHHMFLKHLHTWLVLRNIMFLALAHMVGATQHHVSCTCTHGWCYATSWGGVGWGWQRSLHLQTWSVLRNIMFVDVNVRIKLVCICTINGFLLPKFKHWWWPNHRHSKEQPQKAWLSDIAICSHVQIHCACQCIVTLAPKILWPTALLNAWTIMTFPKSSFYHTNLTFLARINVWMIDFPSSNARIKKISPAQNTILCRKWLLQKLTFHHNEITIFEHSQYPTQRTFGEPPAPSVYIYIYVLCVYTYVDIYIYV